MLEFSDVIERIKDVICFDYQDGKVLDKHVAYELGLKPETLASKKNKNLVPYSELAAFAIRRKISTNWLLFGIGKTEMDYNK